MFKKNFNVKNNVALRNSDIRKVIALLPDNVRETIDKKAAVARVNIVDFNGQESFVYTFNKVPLMVDEKKAGNYFPTVYYLFNNPTSYPLVLINQATFQFIENGADLMLPGIIQNKLPYPRYEKGDVVTIGIFSEGKIRGPIAVGRALMSSQDAISNRFQGRGFAILHWLHDHLWLFGTKETPPSHQLSIFGTALESENFNVADVDEFPAISGLSVNKPIEKEQPKEEVQEESAVPVEEPSEESVPQESMEDLLLRCFLAGLTQKLPKSRLPIDAGEFYLYFVLLVVPPDHKLDMKKTKFKKFSAFLNELNKHEAGPLLKLTKNKSSGDLVIDSYFSNHPLIKGFKLTDEVVKEETEDKKTLGPKIVELLTVTAPVVPFLQSVRKVSKGDLITVTQVRDAVTDYVKLKELKDENGKYVKTDPIICEAINIKAEKIDWNTLMQKIQSKMTLTYLIKTADGRNFVHKMAIPKIVFKVEKRTGNKNVTLVNNLSVFGIEPKDLVHSIKVGTATNATENKEVPQCEGPQLQVQGNHVGFIGQLLTNDYGIDKKFIEGLNLAPKKR